MCTQEIKISIRPGSSTVLRFAQPVLLHLIKIHLIVSAIIANCFASELIDFFNNQNRCDYLILTPREFSSGAEKLADYRNTIPYDDVQDARFFIINNLPDYLRSTAPDTLIFNALRWALENWILKPQYVVFIGDDSIVRTPGDSIFHSGGFMSTHIEWDISTHIIENGGIKDTIRDTVIEYYDSWYQEDERRDPLFSFGRIPCENIEQLEIYLQKIKNYENADAGIWNNKVLFFADDSINGGFRDPVPHEHLIWTSFDSINNRFAEFVFFSDFPEGNNRVANAKNAFFQAVNNKVNWVILSTHGHPGFVTSEEVLTAADHVMFNNMQNPVILFSLSCSNGAFYKKTDSSMCKSFLFSTNGGAVAYIASPNITYISLNDVFIRKVCNTCNKNPQYSIGHLIKHAKAGNQSKWIDYEVLGDPAIPLKRKESVKISAFVLNEDTVSCSIENSTLINGKCVWQIRKRYIIEEFGGKLRDSILHDGDMEFQGNLFQFPLPVNVPDSAYLTLYVWNDLYEGRTGIDFSKETSIVKFPNYHKDKGPFYVTVKSKSMKFHFGHSLKNQASIEFYKLNGQRVRLLPVLKGSESFRFNFSGKNVLAGTFVIILRSKNRVLGKQTLHLF